MTRRTLLTGLAAAGAAGAAADPLDGLLNGYGDPGYAIPAWAGGVHAGAEDIVIADGLANVVTGRGMTPASPVRVASLSKLVTTLGFMMLVEAGKVGLDDDASDILGFTVRHPGFPRERVTPRRLLSHTSGLRDGPAYPVAPLRPLSTSLGVDGGWFGPDAEPPGDWFAYCNSGFVLIGQMIERLTGEPFGPYMTDRLFRPLHLDCGYNWSGVSQAARDRAGVLYRKAQSDEGPYDPAGPWIAQIDESLPPASALPVVSGKAVDSYKPGTNGFAFSPQGGLRASVGDLLSIANMFSLGPEPLLSRASLRQMMEPVWRFDPKRPNGDAYGGAIRAYGLGCQTLTGVDGDNLFDGCAGWIGHAGDAYGLTSGFWIEPGTGRSMVYVITGEARALKTNRGRSNFTRQEEALAGVLSQV